MTWVLITGATSGIGKEAALRLAQQGARVIATGRNAAKVDALVAEADASGLSLQTAMLDVNDPESVALAADVVEAMTGGYGVDVLVNNAGYGEMTPVVRCSHARAARMFETNLVGAARVIRAFLPAMRARGRGRILDVSSQLGRMVVPMQGVYCGTKHAMTAMNDALRLEVARFGVDVILLEPGSVDTEFNDVAFDPLDELLDDPDFGAAAQRLRQLEPTYRATAASVETLADAVVRLSLDERPGPRHTVPAAAAAQLTAYRASPRGLREGLFSAAMGLTGGASTAAAPTRDALVTGAAGGIGRATAFALAKIGYRVHATDVDEAGLEDVARHAAEQRLEIGTRVMDVTDEASVAQVAGELELDLLVNNAGYAEIGPIELAPDSAWHDQLAVNVLGLLSVTRAFAPAMIRRRRGRIVNVSSVVGSLTFPFLGVYGASKHAVEAITDATRMELAGHGVSVSAVQPAFIRSGFTARAKQSLARYDLASGPYRASAGKMDAILDKLDALGGEPSDVARAVVRAVKSGSPSARYQTPLSAWVAVRAVPWLPVELADAGMHRFMGMRG